MGKGSKPRPFTDRAVYEDEHKRIFKCHHRWANTRDGGRKCVKCGENEKEK